MENIPVDILKIIIKYNTEMNHYRKYKKCIENIKKIIWFKSSTYKDHYTSKLYGTYLSDITCKNFGVVNICVCKKCGYNHKSSICNCFFTS